MAEMVYSDSLYAADVSNIYTFTRVLRRFGASTVHAQTDGAMPVTQQREDEVESHYHTLLFTCQPAGPAAKTDFSRRHMLALSFTKNTTALIREQH